MRKYETIVISDPDLQDQARAELFDKIRNVMAKENGIFLSLDDWGSKKLAYEIRKKLRGHYACLTFGGTGDLVKELERNLRLNENVMKYMTILVSDDVTAESLAQEVKDAEAAKAASDAAKAASVAETATETDADTGVKTSEQPVKTAQASGSDEPAAQTETQTDETVTDDQN
ncbi:MAG: 30S ribosomal protein S6 [Desulfotignum sp.]|nr:30S ribosomal protein S6 [Desulfobacteraceae bacterium]